MNKLITLAIHIWFLCLYILLEIFLKSHDIWMWIALLMSLCFVKAVISCLSAINYANKQKELVDSMIEYNGISDRQYMKFEQWMRNWRGK